MNSIVESELQRARWRRSLERLTLDRVDRGDFGTGGITARLKAPSVVALLLSADPEQDSQIELSDSFATWLKTAQSVNLNETRLVLGGDYHQPTAHATAFTPAYSQSRPWENYFAVYRSGALEFGLGNRGARESFKQDKEPVRIFFLSTIVGYIWAMMTFATDFQQHHSISGPWRMTIAAIQTKNGLLGNFAEGWAEPEFAFANEVHGCPDPHLLWHLELDRLPNREQAQAFAFGIGNRFEDAWGSSQRRYCSRTGTHVGKFDPDRVAS